MNKKTSEAIQRSLEKALQPPHKPKREAINSLEENPKQPSLDRLLEEYDDGRPLQFSSPVQKQIQVIVEKLARIQGELDQLKESQQQTSE